MTQNENHPQRKIESRAKKIVEKREKKTWDLSPASIIKREIDLTLEHFDKSHSIHRKQLQNLSEMESYTNTELMQMEERTPRYSPYRFPEREKLQRRLLGLEQEKRRLWATHEEKMQSLDERLLSLLEKHNQLSILENGD